MRMKQFIEQLNNITICLCAIMGANIFIIYVIHYFGSSFTNAFDHWFYVINISIFVVGVIAKVFSDHFFARSNQLNFIHKEVVFIDRPGGKYDN